MGNRRLGMRACALLVTALLGGGAWGCGDSGDEDAAPPAPMPTASREDFPSASQLNAQLAKLPEGPILSPAVSLLTTGRNRLGFALFDRARKQLTNAEVALYTSTPRGTAVRGPFLARSESLEVKPAFESQTTAQDAGAAHAVYVADVPFPKRGKQLIIALARLDGRVVRTNAHQLEVRAPGAGGPPDVGEPAIRVHTPTAASVGGDLEKISTRVPPAPELHKVDFADALGKQPVVLVFATPQLCASRVCGPVVDVAEQVRSEVGGKAAFIHMEIYNDNEISKGFRPQVAAWKLPTEPWIFVVDRSGRIAARFEGAVSVAELDRAVQQVIS